MALLFWYQVTSYLNVVIAIVYGFVGVFVAGQNLQDFYPVTAFLRIINYDNGSLIYHGSVSYLTVMITIAASGILWIIETGELEKNLFWYRINSLMSIWIYSKFDIQM